MSLQRRAFTLIEMLITVGLIMLLASLVVVVLRGVREGANRVDSSNALRQMVLAYNSYSTDNKQHLMPGYLSAGRLAQLAINPKMASGVPINPTGSAPDPNDASSYVWRLAPYLDHAWETYFADYRSRELLSRLDLEFQRDVYGPGTADWTAGARELGISLIPSFGLNTIYLGGDDIHGGSDVTDRNPWDNPGNKLAATRYSEIKNPAQIIVFAATAHFGEEDEATGNDIFPPGFSPITEVEFGYAELRPPYVDGVQHWFIDDHSIVPASPLFFSATDGDGRPIGGGVPVARWGKDLVPCGHLEGSVTTENRYRMAQDMSMWLPDASGFRPDS